MNRCKGRMLPIVWIMPLCLMFFQSLEAQSADSLVEVLVKAGYENVGVYDEPKERVVVIENSAWRAYGRGVEAATQLIDDAHFAGDKPVRMVVLNDALPMFSVSRSLDSTGSWSAGYELGEYWKAVRQEKRANRSSHKFDLVFYPQFAFRNQKFEKVYDILLNLNPTLEYSPVKGMRLYAQVILPIYNEYGPLYANVRPGFLVLEQRFRVENVFIKGAVGNFSKNRWGMDVEAYRPFASRGVGSRFAVQARVGLTGSSYFFKETGWNWNYGPLSVWTWSVGGSYYERHFNLMGSLKVEKYLAGDIGVRADLTRFFRQMSLGLYVMRNNRKNFDGGFHFAFVIPPAKEKRGKWCRVSPATCFDLEYNAAGLFYNGKSYRTNPNSNPYTNNCMNPNYIDSQLN
ncbi:MAG: hypothetical protein PHV49_02390 [Alistipes sp.]|nr:hypothetical protein [Alistipes sp.]